MAYMSQERKKEIAVNVKAVAKKYGFTGREVTVGVRHHSTLVVNIFGGPLDFLGAAQKSNDEYTRMRGEQSYPVGTYLQVHHTWAEDQMRKIGETVIADFYKELIEAIMSTGYYNNSDAMTDYFDHDFYIDINVGKWDRPYNYREELKEAA